jgi:zinc protease
MSFVYRFPAMDETVLENGLRLILVPDHEQQGCVITIQLPTGRFADPAGAEGLCELTVGLLSKGTESFSSDDFSARLENAGATLFTDVGEEHSVVGLRLLTPAIRRLLPVFVEMVARPAFVPEEFSRLQREMRTALRAETADASLIASRHFYREICGAGHPAGRIQTPKSLRKVALADVRDFYDRAIIPRGAVCVIAGDFEIADFKPFAVQQLSFWNRADRAPAHIVAAPSAPGSPVIRLINKPDVTQVSLAIGHAAPGEMCPDKNALLLANHIFGGGNFSSRLMTRIRTADGKTYGISSQLLSETEFGTFIISTSTRNAELTAVLTGIIEEYRRLVAEGVTAEELQRAKQFAIGNMAFQLEGIGNMVDKLLWLRFYGRENSYIERFEELVGSIDVAAVNHAIKQHLGPEHLVIAAVGRTKELLPQIQQFGAVKQFHFRDSL